MPEGRAQHHRVDDAEERRVYAGAEREHARWTNRGELVYWAVPAGVDAVAFTSGADTFRVGARRTLVQTPILSAIDGRPHYDITRDGTRLLVRQSAGPQGPGIRVILNWRSKLTR